MYIAVVFRAVLLEDLAKDAEGGEMQATFLIALSIIISG